MPMHWQFRCGKQMVTNDPCGRASQPQMHPTGKSRAYMKCTRLPRQRGSPQAQPGQAFAPCRRRRLAWPCFVRQLGNNAPPVARNNAQMVLAER